MQDSRLVIFSWLLLVSYFCCILFTSRTVLHTTLKDRVQSVDTDRSQLPPNEYNDAADSETSGERQIEIWSKAAIGWYLWNSIFNARLKEREEAPWTVGTRRFSQYLFTFRSGPGLMPDTAPSYVRHLVLVLNGRTAEKVRSARQWLDLLPGLPQLRRAAVVLHGNELCQNDWIRPYLRQNGGLVDLVFVTYDDPTVDNSTVFQWPLGVATYRGFPQGPFSLPTEGRRRWSCNFLATVYPNSSRQRLHETLQTLPDHNCLIRTRQHWVQEEGQDSMSGYVEALLGSELTLSPAGENVECYRLYEAASLGSVPVLLRSDAPAAAGRCARPGLRLLRQHGAPFLWLDSWDQLRQLLRRETNLSDAARTQRRSRLLAWYNTFKLRLRRAFISTVVGKFFPSEH